MYILQHILFTQYLGKTILWEQDRPAEAQSFKFYFDYFYVWVFREMPSTAKTNLEEDNYGTNEHADALEKISNHMDKCCSHTGIGLLSSLS